MSRLSKYAQNKTSRFAQKKLLLIGGKLALAACGGLAYYFPIFGDGNVAADGLVYLIIIATGGFLWWEFCR